MLNKVMLIGRLGRAPELRYMQSGAPVASLSVATDESYTDRDGNKVDRTEWHRVSVYNKSAENCANYLGKGSLVYVEGSLQTRKWQDQQGQDRYTTEIKAQRVLFLDRKGEGRAQQPPEDGWHGGNRAPYGGAQQQRQAPPRNDAPVDDYPGPAFPSEVGMNRGNSGGGGDDVPFSQMDEVPF